MKNVILAKNLFFTLICLSIVLSFCDKKEAIIEDPAVPPAVHQDANLSYKDSVFYVKEGADKYIILPVTSQSGKYSAFPYGLEIDESTGAIDINESETGLKFIVSFVPSKSTDTLSTSIIISGINYFDKIYNLSKGDSIASPIYNAHTKLGLPGVNDGNVFDESGGCKKAGIVVDFKNAQINLAESVRNQSLDTGSTEVVKLRYRISDQSNKALNTLDVKIYFYRTVKEIPQYLSDLLEVRKGTILTANTSQTIFSLPSSNFNHTNFSVSNAVAKARPRPPCIIVVSR